MLVVNTGVRLRDSSTSDREGLFVAGAWSGVATASRSRLARVSVVFVRPRFLCEGDSNRDIINDEVVKVLVC